MSRITLALITLLALMSMREARAVDGVIEINQAGALAGGVTVGDAAGFPVTISQAGSYRLTGNLTNPIDKTAIEINATNVTLDLNGFLVSSTNACSGYPPTGCTVINGAPGINSEQYLVVVRNGAVQNMGGPCIRLIGPSSSVERVRVLSCGSYGIQVGATGRVEQSFAGLNYFIGIVLDNGGTAEGNEARGNRSSGISIANSNPLWGSSIGNRSYENGSFGIGGGLTSRNVISGNVGAPFGGSTVSLGDNLCNGVRC